MIVAAIKQDDIVYIERRGDEGKKRHHEIIFMMRERGVVWNITEVQGFITDTGEFLNRKDAFKHFVDSGQVSKDGLRGDQLYSEDLF